MIGHKGHPEVEGTMGQMDEAEDTSLAMYLVEHPEDVSKLQVSNPDKLAYVTQTTLSMEDATAVINALKTKFPKIHAPKSDDICYATQIAKMPLKSWQKTVI